MSSASPHWALPTIACPLAWLLVAATRRYALSRNVLDLPGSRSSHRVPTPRGGGIGVVLAVLLVTIPIELRAGVGLVPIAIAAAAVLSVAYVGWSDDRASLSVAVRLPVHAAAGVAVALLAPTFGRWPAVAALWWVFWTMSCINVINFIDGIDGLIGAQFVIFGAYVATLAPPHGVARALGIAVSAASLGFLVWNWSPAKIFLGDVGSGAYGVLAALAGGMLTRETDMSVIAAFVPLAPVFIDASSTLLRRARRGERLTEAHRSHLYQRLANGPWTHQRTAIVYAVASATGGTLMVVTHGALAAAVAYLLGILAIGLWLDVRRAPWPKSDHPAVME